MKRALIAPSKSAAKFYFKGPSTSSNATIINDGVHLFHLQLYMN